MAIKYICNVKEAHESDCGAQGVSSSTAWIQVAQRLIWEYAVLRKLDLEMIAGDASSHVNWINW